MAGWRGLAGALDAFVAGKACCDLASGPDADGRALLGSERTHQSALMRAGRGGLAQERGGWVAQEQRRCGSCSLLQNHDAGYSCVPLYIDAAAPAARSQSCFCVTHSFWGAAARRGGGLGGVYTSDHNGVASIDCAAGGDAGDSCVLLEIDAAARAALSQSCL